MYGISGCVSVTVSLRQLRECAVGHTANLVGFNMKLSIRTDPEGKSRRSSLINLMSAREYVFIFNRS
jgi:hypothetical protein